VKTLPNFFPKAEKPSVVEILQTNAFRRAYKRLRANQKASVDTAVAAIASDPTLGEAKKGDLAGVHVYKFQCVGALFLLAYEYDPETRLLLLVGTHENFYRELKRQ
jgi:mRNA interferase RelE/StbE